MFRQDRLRCQRIEAFLDRKDCVNTPTAGCGIANLGVLRETWLTTGRDSIRAKTTNAKLTDF